MRETFSSRMLNNRETNQKKHMQSAASFFAVGTYCPDEEKGYMSYDLFEKWYVLCKIK